MPDFGSSTTTTSASVSATRSWSRAASTASSTVLPVISTHSMDYWPFRGRLSLARGCGLGPLPDPVEPDEPDARGLFGFFVPEPFFDPF